MNTIDKTAQSDAVRFGQSSSLSNFIPQMLRPALQYAREPAAATLVLIAGTTVLRLAFGTFTGLGVDESYMVAAGRQLQLSYFDHPPIAWWLTWCASHLLGSEGHLAVRLPFILLFATSTWLLFRIATTIYGPHSGFWSAVILNIIPVFGVTTASWVLPDGPLDCALLLATLCLLRALKTGSTRYWLGAGAAFGIALLSKYTAILTGAGALIYLATQPWDRRWLARPISYVAALGALVLFAPVIIWNADNGWQSFAFQGARAGGIQIHPVAPLVGLAGEALFLLPWIWFMLMRQGVRALRQGPSETNTWLLCCLGLTPVAVFTAISLFASQPIMFHWAAPGYLLLIPLLGHSVACSALRGHKALVSVVWGSALFLVAALAIGTSEIRWNWLPDIGEHFAMGRDPDLNGLDWSSLRTQLDSRARALGLHDTVIAGVNWHDTGKLSYALGPDSKVICLCSDAREFGILGRDRVPAGFRALIVLPGKSSGEIARLLASEHIAATELEPLYLMHDGERAMRIPLYLQRAEQRTGTEASPQRHRTLSTTG
ncbi:MAG: glycosyltransferase family 39 protein [Proteobacteria bacterium]|nr:glycosyltransferase family 39 protein [Pseudomonadota bacterium]